jgi:segregation and condensation protein B
LLTPGPLKTLSFIALKQPVTQSYVVRVRGKLTYQYVKQLEDLELVSESKLGRTKVLRTTRVFSDYFNLSQDTRLMKRQLERLFKELSPAKDEEKGKET